MRRFLVGGFWCAVVGVIVALNAGPVELGVHATFSAVAILTLAILRRWRQQRFVRIFTLMVMLALGLRYMFWRTDFTLTYADFFSFIGTILLYAAEVYGFLIFLFGLIVNLSPISRVFPTALHSLRAAEKLSGSASQAGARCTAPASCC